MKSAIPQSEAGSIVSGNKFFQWRNSNINNSGSGSGSCTTTYAYIGIPSSHGTGVMNVVNNVRRGNDNNSAKGINRKEIGLMYGAGNGQQL